MLNRKQIASFQSQAELAIAKNKLESEGIETYVEDELTIQAYNFIADAIGGIKLYVSQKDYAASVEILLECGIIIDKKTKPNNLEKVLGTPRRFKIFKIVVTSSIVIISALIVFAIAYKIYSLPNTSEKLVYNEWCVDHLFYNELYYYPNTISNTPQIVIGCREKINFRSNQKVIFPGFQTPKIEGDWEIKNDSLIVTNVDYIKFFYEKRFLVSFNHNQLILKSDSVDIVCIKSRY